MNRNLRIVRNSILIVAAAGLAAGVTSFIFRPAQRLSRRVSFSTQDPFDDARIVRIKSNLRKGVTLDRMDQNYLISSAERPSFYKRMVAFLILVDATRHGQFLQPKLLGLLESDARSASAKETRAYIGCYALALDLQTKMSQKSMAKLYKIYAIESDGYLKAGEEQLVKESLAKADFAERHLAGEIIGGKQGLDHKNFQWAMSTLETQCLLSKGNERKYWSFISRLAKFRSPQLQVKPPSPEGGRAVSIGT